MTDLFETSADPPRGKRVITALKLKNNSLFREQVSWEEEERHPPDYSGVSSNLGCFHLSTNLSKSHWKEFQESRIVPTTSIVKTYSSGYLKACWECPQSFDNRIICNATCHPGTKIYDTISINYYVITIASFLIKRTCQGWIHISGSTANKQQLERKSRSVDNNLVGVSVLALQIENVNENPHFCRYVEGTVGKRGQVKRKWGSARGRMLSWMTARWITAHQQRASFKAANDISKFLLLMWIIRSNISKL